MLVRNTVEILDNFDTKITNAILEGFDLLFSNYKSWEIPLSFFSIYLFTGLHGVNFRSYYNGFNICLTLLKQYSKRAVMNSLEFLNSPFQCYLNIIDSLGLLSILYRIRYLLNHLSYNQFL